MKIKVPNFYQPPSNLDTNIKEKRKLVLFNYIVELSKKQQTLRFYNNIHSSTFKDLINYGNPGEYLQQLKTNRWIDINNKYSGEGKYGKMFSKSYRLGFQVEKDGFKEIEINYVIKQKPIQIQQTILVPIQPNNYEELLLKVSEKEREKMRKEYPTYEKLLAAYKIHLLNKRNGKI